MYAYVGNNPVMYVDPWGLEENGPMAGKIIVRQNGVTVEHYGTSDHGPAHAHVKGGGPETKVGPKGNELKGQNDLTPKQRSVVRNNKNLIRNELNKLGRANKRIENTPKIGIFGFIMILLDAYDADIRAKERGVSPWIIMLEDMGYYYPSDPTCCT